MEPISVSPKEPIADQIIIHLIREELKSRKFFEGLRELGLDDAFYQADLLELIMAAMGLPISSEKCYSFCHDLLKKHSTRVEQDADELLNEARRVYGILALHAISYGQGEAHLGGR